MFDKNKRGVLLDRDLMNGLSEILDEEIPQAQIKMFMKYLDKNENGKIEQSEFKAMLGDTSPNFSSTNGDDLERADQAGPPSPRAQQRPKPQP